MRRYSLFGSARRRRASSVGAVDISTLGAQVSHLIAIQISQTGNWDGLKRKRIGAASRGGLLVPMIVKLDSRLSTIGPFQRQSGAAESPAWVPGGFLPLQRGPDRIAEVASCSQ